MGKITQFLESDTWYIIRCVLFLILFIYLLVTHVVQLPGTRHVVWIIISVLGIIVELQGLLMVLKHRSSGS